jgi:hypothetical protein
MDVDLELILKMVIEMDLVKSGFWNEFRYGIWIMKLDMITDTWIMELVSDT